MGASCVLPSVASLTARSVYIWYLQKKELDKTSESFWPHCGTISIQTQYAIK
jgi:hypothetical protein